MERELGYTTSIHPPQALGTSPQPRAGTLGEEEEQGPEDSSGAGLAAST